MSIRNYDIRWLPLARFEVDIMFSGFEEVEIECSAHNEMVRQTKSVKEGRHVKELVIL